MIGTYPMARRQQRRRLHTVRAFAGEIEGIAALEFALLAPLMIYMMLVASDIASALTVTRRMTNAADVIAELVSQQVSQQLVTQENGSQASAYTVTGNVTNALLVQNINSIILTLPDILVDAASQGENWQADIQPIVSSVSFGPAAKCAIASPPVSPTPVVTSICSTATVTWSVGFKNAGFTPNTRTCGAATVGPNDASRSSTTIPTGMLTPGTVLTTNPLTTTPGTAIVVDISYVFNPLFTAWLTGPFLFHRTAYISPRFFSQLTYVPPNNGTTPKGGTTTTFTDTSSDASAEIVSCTFNGALP